MRGLIDNLPFRLYPNRSNHTIGLKMIFLSLGAIFALISVGAGAFGAHALKTTLPADRLDIFDTAAKYQMYHALALCVVGWAEQHFARGSFGVSGWMFVAGIVLFSGSLYILSLSGVRWWGAVTPLGGVAFLIGWATLAWQFLRRP